MYEQIARNKRRSVVLVIAFMLVWLGAGALIGWLVATTTHQPGAAAPVAADLATATAAAGVLALLAVVFSLTSGSNLVLAVAGATPADPQRHRRVYDLVSALAIGDGLPMPAVYVVDDPSPNAFATGVSPQRAAITVTTGLLAVMDREELEGVLGHEMSHIKNYDTRLLLIVTTLIGMAGLLASVVWRSAFFVRGRSREGASVTLVVLAAGLLLAVVGFLVGPVIRLAVSRRRESLADASSVQLTRNPVGLIRALRELQANDRPLARTNHATAAMCIDDPLQHHEGAIHRLFDTHPPIEERIAALERMAEGMSV
ncbi:MAG TPA: M48 family metallopeptidase [Jatrophihabitans sp.]|nr:M48 family metallopeptidase [Jatrophihabitans sp.]